jgi:hypothetical protein
MFIKMLRCRGELALFSPPPPLEHHAWTPLTPRGFHGDLFSEGPDKRLVLRGVRTRSNATWRTEYVHYCEFSASRAHRVHVPENCLTVKQKKKKTRAHIGTGRHGFSSDTTHVCTQTMCTFVKIIIFIPQWPCCVDDPVHARDVRQTVLHRRLKVGSEIRWKSDFQNRESYERFVCSSGFYTNRVVWHDRKNAENRVDYFFQLVLTKKIAYRHHIFTIHVLSGVDIIFF